MKFTVCDRNLESVASAFFMFVATALFVLMPPPAHAQVSGATLTSTVSDSTGAVIPSAQVSIENEGTGENRAVTADSIGFHSAPNV
jgi:hypothetical protein